MRFGIHAGPQDCTLDDLRRLWAVADERGYTVLVERDRDESRSIGFTIEDGALEGAEPPAPAVGRRERVEGCARCESAATDPLVPLHDAAPGCESGHREHCTCAVCF